MSVARILLLNPPTAAVSTEPLLNLGYLATVLRKRGHDVRIIDSTAPYRSYSDEDIFDFVSEYKPHFIGVTLTIDFIQQSYIFIERLAKLKVPIVAGGPHPNSRPKETLLHGSNIVCVGEGEVTVVELAEYFLGQRDLASINGICYKDETGEVIFTNPRSFISDLDTIPFIDFTDFPIANYTGSDNSDSNSIFWSIFSSRGCPFNCIYCSSHNVFGRSMRLRSARNIVEEIKHLVQCFGIKSIAFQDDEILCNKKRFIEFCDLIVASGLKLKMSIRTRIDSITPEILAKAKAAGIKRFSFGVESWDDETLRLINKCYVSKTIHTSFQYLAKAQPLPIFFSNICGFPWQTRKHYSNIVRQIKKIPWEVKFFTCMVTPIPYPETELYDCYHDKFEFTDWWLDQKHYTYVSQLKNERPFFLLFASAFRTMYTKNIFWSYTSRQIKDIEWFTWRVFYLFLQRHFNIIERSIIYLLCRISHQLWLKYPKIEKIMFDWLKNNIWFCNLVKQINFREKYAQDG